jgi:hypothetical protein
VVDSIDTIGTVDLPSPFFQGSLKIDARIYLALAFATWPTLAMADVVWPALFLEIRLLSWWAIASGLLAEYLFVRWLFSLSIKRAVIATVSANAASTVLGILLIPLAGIAWEIFPGSVYMGILKWGTFNPIPSKS